VGLPEQNQSFLAAMHMALRETLAIAA